MVWPTFRSTTATEQNSSSNGSSGCVQSSLNGQHQEMDMTPRGRVGRDKWRKYVRGVANLQIDDGYRTEQTRTVVVTVTSTLTVVVVVVFKLEQLYLSSQ